MPDVEVVDPLTREARRDILPFLFLFKDKREESLDGRRGDIVAVGTLDERLAP